VVEYSLGEGKMKQKRGAQKPSVVQRLLELTQLAEDVKRAISKSKGGTLTLVRRQRLQESDEEGHAALADRGFIIKDHILGCPARLHRMATCRCEPTYGIYQ
jgi:hypothetical protein